MTPVRVLAGCAVAAVALAVYVIATPTVVLNGLIIVPVLLLGGTVLFVAAVTAGHGIDPTPDPIPERPEP